MKVAIICDTHFGVRNDSELFLDFQKKFFDNVFFPYLKKHDITTVIDLGDTFDRRKFINFKTFEMSKKFFFDPLRDNNIDTHILVGNHTTFYKNTNKLNSVDLLLKEYKNIKIYESPQDITFGNLTLAAVPWINPENETSVFNYVQETNAPICVGHFEFAGFQTLQGITHDEGLSTDAFKKFEKVLSGHFHYKHDNGHVFYLGCPYEMMWSSSPFPEEKGFHILDTDTKVVTFIENPYRIFNKIRYNDGVITAVNAQGMSNKVNIPDLAATYVKIFVGKKSDPYAFDVFLDQVFAVSPAHVTVVEETLLNVDDEPLQIEQLNDTMSLLTSYIDKMEVTVDKSSLKKIANTIYTEAVNTQSNLS